MASSVFAQEPLIPTPMMLLDHQQPVYTQMPPLGLRLWDRVTQIPFTTVVHPLAPILQISWTQPPWSQGRLSALNVKEFWPAEQYIVMRTIHRNAAEKDAHPQPACTGRMTSGCVLYSSQLFSSQLHGFVFIELTLLSYSEYDPDPCALCREHC